MHVSRPGHIYHPNPRKKNWSQLILIESNTAEDVEKAFPRGGGGKTVEQNTHKKVRKQVAHHPYICFFLTHSISNSYISFLGVKFQTLIHLRSPKLSIHLQSEERTVMHHTNMVKSKRVCTLLLRVLALCATIAAAIVMGTSHEKSSFFTMQFEAKYNHTPAFT